MITEFTVRLSAWNLFEIDFDDVPRGLHASRCHELVTPPI